MSQPDRLPTVSHPQTKHPQTRHPETRGIDRRTVLRGAGAVGAGVVGMATLAACGGGGDSAAPAAEAPAAKDGIKTADIPVGGGTVFVATKVVVTQPQAGMFRAFSAICTHKGCTVAAVANGTINCPCHGSAFNLATGAVVAGPAPAPLPSRPVTVKGATITVA